MRCDPVIALYFLKIMYSQVWWHTLLIPALGGSGRWVSNQPDSEFQGSYIK